MFQYKNSFKPNTEAFCKWFCVSKWTDMRNFLHSAGFNYWSEIFARKKRKALTDFEVNIFITLKQKHVYE